ncbi:hypothetical protein B0A50_01048 [Salinomyces thailandicus]|uniref:N-acetyltransferase domain-containing protein n=1 Tax=Salinomyces thailandicus TaxID=706561 RepID=A0A4U0UBJ4_9PEZI|nr:hypothetical protein B0A50_01048 [Salinomyces thailandica]
MLKTGSQGPAISTNFAVAFKDEASGSIGLEVQNGVYFRTAKVGYWLGLEHWGKGIMSRLVPPFVQWAWESFDVLGRLNAETAETNLASGKVLHKAGFKFEGRRPDVVCKNRAILAVLMWGAMKPR